MAESDLMDELTGTKSPVRTVRVRLLVAVWPDGGWRSHGVWYGQRPDTTTREFRRAMGHDADSATFTWIEADVPLPAEPEVVPGRVVGGGE